ncbi:MAG: polysaccharide deacetylase [Lachnospiraceae bacterium]|nr:polysaccharide deacetylase [Lachnospiraceae bacterium]MBR6271137.1 polysaccharide deacetylase [Lachnospiraceae bacterium]
MSEYRENNVTSRNERRRRRRRQAMIRRVCFGIIFAALIALIILLCIKIFGGGGSSEQTETTPQQQGQSSENGESQAPETGSSNQAAIDEAAILAAQYDYDAAIEKLKGIAGYQDKKEITDLIADYELTRDTCVTVDMSTVPHVFFHTLICDFNRCFKSSHNQSLMNGYNAWMVTVDEFKECIRQLYDLGYVIINIGDSYTKDADGNYSMSTDVKLPTGKKALILSYDDTCYYCQYMDWGMADRVILDENGDLKCEYTDESGNTTVGDYDHIPILIDFCREHPDFAWHGHKGTLALTGYDGILGYRTEFRMFDYPTGDETAWLQANPWCQKSEIETYKEQAKVIVQALKDNGYEFASHTWGHRHADQKGLDWLKQDTEWWCERVESLTGDTDIFVFPHGGDIGSGDDYTSSNEKYSYLKSMGFGVFCGVDGTSLYWNQYRSGYVRQSRINIDGINMYQTLQGKATALTKLGLDVEKIFDTRRPTPITAS